MKIQSLIDEVMSEICEKYCKWPEQSENMEELMKEHCKNCPIVVKL